MKLFQKEKLESEVNDLQSIIIVLSHSLFLKKESWISEKWVKRQLISVVIFLFLAAILTGIASAF